MEDAGGPAQPRERFLQRFRLRKRREYLEVQQGGRKHHVEHFMIVVAAQPAKGPSRLGITVTRKVGNAVARNRIKRHVREVFRRHRARLPDGLDVVVIAKRNAAVVGHAQVERELVVLFERLGERA